LNGKGREGLGFVEGGANGGYDFEVGDIVIQKIRESGYFRQRVSHCATKGSFDR